MCTRLRTEATKPNGRRRHFKLAMTPQHTQTPTPNATQGRSVAPPHHGHAAATRVCALLLVLVVVGSVGFLCWWDGGIQRPADPSVAIAQNHDAHAAHGI